MHLCQLASIHIYICIHIHILVVHSCACVHTSGRVCVMCVMCVMCSLYTSGA